MNRGKTRVFRIFATGFGDIKWNFFKKSWWNVEVFYIARWFGAEHNFIKKIEVQLLPFQAPQDGPLLVVNGVVTLIIPL